VNFTSLCILDLGLKIESFTIRSSDFVFKPLQASQPMQWGRGGTASGGVVGIRLTGDELGWGEVRVGT
jgi:hypothetical protein